MARAIDADAVLDRYYAEFDRQDICDGSQDRDWLMRCIEEAPTLTQPNEPLTLEELREMDGEPVWVEELNCWALVYIFVIKGIEIPFALFDDGCIETFNISCKDLHCYRRPPVGEEETP